MIYFMVDQANKESYKFETRKDLEKAKCCMPYFDKHGQDYHLQVSIDERGNVSLKDRTNEDLEDGVVIARVGAGLSPEQKQTKIKMVEKLLTINFDANLGYEFAIKGVAKARQSAHCQMTP